MTVTTKRIGDFIAPPFDCDDTRAADSLGDVDFLLKEVRMREGQFGEYAAMLCDDLKTNKEFVVNCGSDVVLKKLKEAMKKTKLPILAKIVKVKNYLDMF